MGPGERRAVQHRQDVALGDAARAGVERRRREASPRGVDQHARQGEGVRHHHGAHQPDDVRFGLSRSRDARPAVDRGQAERGRHAGRGLRTAHRYALKVHLPGVFRRDRGRS